ncbi:MAG: metallophosphoesterase family protein [Planctomycetota bacterium]|nr:metallophosphoesterase family protein [Planctomycetota bacterium]
MNENPTRVCLIAFVCLLFSCLAAWPQDPQKNHITHGPILGRLSSSGVGVWARTGEPGTLVVLYGTSPESLDQRSDGVKTSREHDNTGWVQLSGLAADTTYYYRMILPDVHENTGRQGSFRTMPDSKDYLHPTLNPRGLFNFKFEYACGNNQNPGQSNGPGLPAFETMIRQLKGDINFAILNGDWLYETQREYTPDQWRNQVGLLEGASPDVVQVAPTIVGVWQNYKHFLDQGPALTRWHRDIPSFFTYDDHEILNDVWGAGSPGLRDRRAVFRDIGVRAWYDYLGWSNPLPAPQAVRFGHARMVKGSDVLVDMKADFSTLDLGRATNLHVHWGTDTAGVNDNSLDGVGGIANAGVYRIVRVLDKHRLKIEPAPPEDDTVSYSIGRRSYFKMTVSNCDFFVLDTRGQREMHDKEDPYKKGISMLGRDQREWLLEGMKASQADFLFVVSSVNFMLPHVGGGMVRTVNKDDAWTVFYDEREKLIDFWDKLKQPVLVLTGDLHNSFVCKITENVWEFASGPHNSRNHWFTDEGDRPANGRFQYGPRPIDIRWSTHFRNDIPRQELSQPTFCVVQLNNVYNNPLEASGTRWVAFPRPQVVFQYYDGRTGRLRYAESILADPPAGRKPQR